MRKLLFSIVLLLNCVGTFGQYLGDLGYDLTFEDPSQFAHIQLDSNLIRNNLWQIGIPQKSVFTNAYSPQNVIVTDTTSTYPINDTSSFEIINIVDGDGWTMGYEAVLAGFYQVDSDSLTDFGRIELSLDNGSTWIDILNDTVYTTYYYWDLPKPTLTGNSNGWKQFSVNLAQLGVLYNIQYYDTIRFRFTFISDSIQTNKDGLMFDSFHFEDWSEGVTEIRNDNQISIYPTPTSDYLNIKLTKSPSTQRTQVFNYEGKLVDDHKNISANKIDIQKLPNGIYILKYSNSKNYSIKRFVVEH